MAQATISPDSPAVTPTDKRPNLILNFIRHDPAGALGFLAFFAILGLAFIGPLFMPGDNKGNFREVYLPPGGDHWLGTDYMGKDIWYQIVHGGKDLLIVAASAAILSTAVAVILGAFTAIVGGWFDSLLMMITDVVLTVPTIVLLGVLAAFIQLDSKFLLIVILASTGWPVLLRAVRAQVLSLKEREYVEAARMLDLGLPRILFLEILPNMASYIITNFVLGMTGAIYGQVILYFLGLVSLSGNNWGLMIQQAYSQGAHLNQDSQAYIIAPIVVISILQLALVMMARSVEDLFNPRLREA